MKKTKLNLILVVLLSSFWTAISCSNDDGSNDKDSSSSSLSFIGSCSFTTPISGCAAWYSNIEDFTLDTCSGTITDTVCSGTKNANCTHRLDEGTVRLDYYDIAVGDLPAVQTDCEGEGGTFRSL